MNWSSPNLTALEHFNLTLDTTQNAQPKPEIPQNAPKEKVAERSLTTQLVAVMTQITKS